MLSTLLFALTLLFAPPKTPTPATPATPTPAATTIAPDSVAVLTLDAKGSTINTKLLRQTFGEVLTEELIKAPVLGDSFNNLTALFGCDGKDTSCLVQISKSLKVRFVIYGTAAINKTTKEITVDFGLYDSFSDKEISRSKGIILSPEDKTALSGMINQLLSNSIAGPLRKKKLTDNAVPLALQNSSNVDKGTADPRRWFIVPGGLVAGWALIGVSALPLGFQLQRAKLSEKELSIEQQQELGDKRAKFGALLIAGDIALGTAVVVSPFAIRQYKKEKKEQLAAKNAEKQPSPTPAK